MTHIRAATTEDLLAVPTIERLAGQLFRDVGLPEIADDDPPTPEELASAAAVIVAVDADDEVVGYAWIELVDDRAHLEQLSVVPERSRQGVGSALLDAVRAWARDRGDDAITLTTFRDVPFNAPLYTRRGFAVVPEADWSPALRALVAEETEHGLDPAQRVVMRAAVS